jgi:fermentation-respiration switch protein FrsA (DUF1100 family)
LTAPAALVAVFALQRMLDNLIFFPERAMPPTPPGIEDRTIRTADGVRLHAWYATPPGAVATLLWSHGNGGNIGIRDDILIALAARNLAVLAYDYRGYGRSEGTPSEAGVHRDAEAAYDHLRAAGVPAERIVCFGESLGGAVSVRLATERSCAGVAVVAGFLAIRDVARIHYGMLATVVGGRFDVSERIGRLGVPILVANGDRDEIVPYALGERLFAAAREPKLFVRIRGAMHNDVLGYPELLDAIADFARDAVAASGPP